MGPQIKLRRILKKFQYLPVILFIVVGFLFFFFSGKEVETNDDIVHTQKSKLTLSNGFVGNPVFNIQTAYNITENHNNIRYEDLFVPLTKLSDEQKEMKKILIWHFSPDGMTYDKKDAMGYGYGNAPFLYDNCEEPKCILTDNKTLLPITAYDAVIIHFRHSHTITFPKQRLKSQRWIFLEVEPAAYVYDNIERFNYFNWTMTYRRDSDIQIGYGYSEALKNPISLETDISQDLFNSKTKMAAWFVSNCGAQSNRDNVVYEMKKDIRVDVYGLCGTMRCLPPESNKCYRMLEENYKFYLSFENSYCKDYVTEKLFNILKYNIVPIVYGNVNYSQYAPPHSYIDVAEFETIKDLTSYLNYLANNITAYNEYFKWKTNYRILSKRETKAKVFCSLCKALHTRKEEKTYSDMGKWFIKNSHCK